MKNAINSHTGIPHSSTLRNPGWETASTSTTARKNHTMTYCSRPLGRESSIAHPPIAVQNESTQ